MKTFDVPEGKDGWTYLNELCSAGLARRYDPVTPELKDRLDFELETIRSMGFVDYFLIVWDFIRFAKENGIAVGPGRGSAAGSMVSYCLGITDIDPIRYQLFFERFLNPERVTMPDIDVDFCYVRRQEARRAPDRSGSHRLCRREIRAYTGLADRYFRNASGARRDPRCRPCDGSALRDVR